MKIVPTAIADVVLLEPTVFADDRGLFFESFNQRDVNRALGFEPVFVQDNFSQSSRGVVRGLHYQVRQPQGKLISVLAGEIYDVAVDLRRHSPAFGQWVGLILSAADRRQIWIPAGFAHGFSVLSARADVLYKTTDYYAPEHERTIRWNDPTLAIDWPDAGAPCLSPRDLRGARFDAAEVFD